MSNPQDINWQNIILSNDRAYIMLIDKYAEKRFGQGVLSEEGAAYVLESLSADDWAICHKYQGRSSIKTYITIVVKHLLEEFARKRFGKKVPPTWLKREGELWVRLWKQLCLERQSVQALVSRYIANRQYQKHLIETIIKTIKARIPSCGKPALDAQAMENIVQLSDTAAIEGTHREYGMDINDTAEACETVGFDFETDAYLHFFLLMRTFFDDKNTLPAVDDMLYQSAKQLSQHYHDRLEKLVKHFSVNDEELLILKMRYKEGLSGLAVSRALSKPAHQVKAIERKALERFEKACVECELDLSALLNAL